MKTANKIHNCASVKLAQLCLILVFTMVSLIGRAQSNIITTICGQDTAGYCGDGGQATEAALNTPFYVQMDSHGDLYIDDGLNQRIRKIDMATGVITTVAGNGSAGFSGDGGLAVDAQLFVPEGFFIDSVDNIYIADALNERIRKITASTGIITTIAGIGTAGYSGDGGPASAAEFDGLSDVVLDKQGNIYITDFYNNVVRKIDAFSGVINTIAGTGLMGFGGDGGLATNATLNGPVFLLLDGDNNVIFSDLFNNVIRKIDQSSGVISTVAGTGTSGNTGDGGDALSANMRQPEGLAFDNLGNLYFTQYYDGVIRKIEKTTNIITRIAGNGIEGYGGDGGIALAAELGPTNLCFSNLGNIFVADYHNNRIRKISSSVGVQSIAKTNDNVIYPNPSTGRFTVKASNTALADVTICNTVGGTVATAKVDNNHSEIDISNQPNGVYFVNLKTDKDNHVYKVVLAK